MVARGQFAKCAVLRMPGPAHSAAFVSGEGCHSGANVGGHAASGVQQRYFGGLHLGERPAEPVFRSPGEPSGTTVRGTLEASCGTIDRDEPPVSLHPDLGSRSTPLVGMLRRQPQEHRVASFAAEPSFECGSTLR